MPSHWILTCNPQRWDIFKFLHEGHSVADIKNWSIARRFEEVAVGDDVALWVSGPQRGVYAVGKVTGESELAAGDETGYWTGAQDARRQKRSLPISLSIDRSTDPILGSELKADERFADASVVAFPRGVNPHPVDDLQWQAILDRL